VKLGALVWPQYTDWESLQETGALIDRLGYDSLWTWDHLYPIVGHPDGPMFEGYLTLAGWAEHTEQVRLGLMVGANTFRNPALVVKMITTLDHMSGGRMNLGIGGAWFETEHTAFGIEFGSGFGERLDWFDEAVELMRAMLPGGPASARGRFYRATNVLNNPPPVQERLPIMIGGSGEKKTLRTVAKYADLWNAMGPLDVMRHKIEVLRGHCEAVGRDPSAIEFTLGIKATIRDSEAEADRVWKAAMEHNRTPMSDVADDDTFWNGTADQLAEKLAPYVELGFHTVISEQPAPYDMETFERLIGEVGPAVARITG